MNRQSTMGYCSLSSFARKRESRGGTPQRLPPVQARGKLWTPAFAGATITGCEDRLHFEPGSDIYISYQFCLVAKAISPSLPHGAERGSSPSSRVVWIPQRESGE